MLKRAFVQGSPQIIFESTREHVIVQIWPVPGIDENTTGSQVYIHKNKHECDEARGIPLAEHAIDIEILPGETLYAMSTDVGLVGMSIRNVGV